MLLFGKKLTAMEAQERNLVSEVFPAGTFEQECQRRVKEFSTLPPQVSIFDSLVSLSSISVRLKTLLTRIFFFLQSLQLSKGIIRASLKVL